MVNWDTVLTRLTNSPNKYRIFFIKIDVVGNLFITLYRIHFTDSMPGSKSLGSGNGTEWGHNHRPFEGRLKAVRWLLDKKTVEL